MFDLTNYNFSITERVLAVLSLTTASVFISRYALQGPTNIKVAAVALVVITLIAALDLVRYAWSSLKSRHISNTTDSPETPRDFIEYSSERGKLHWQFKLRGKQIEVKVNSYENSLWTNAGGKFKAGKVFSNQPLELPSVPSYSGPLKRTDLPSIETIIEWLESPLAKETNYKNFINSPNERGLLLPVVWTGREADVFSLGVYAAYRAVDIFLKKQENHRQTERITIVFPERQDYGIYPTPSDVGV